MAASSDSSPDAPSVAAKSLRYLAFYLPQFHPIPENDVWWGRGFTEWTNVVQARPLFDGHDQPRVPADLGFYDLRLPETRVAQAELARRHGIDGFVYYHYWFGGRRLLERPFEETLASGVPDFPFALCWANEPWTRKWDGQDATHLVTQTYSEEDDRAHIEYFMRAFRDPRYVRVDGRPLLLIYNIRALPNARATVELWARECRRNGLPAPYVVKCDTFHDDDDPALFGADAACDFPPHGAFRVARVEDVEDPAYHRIDYDDLAHGFALRPPPTWLRYPTVVPSWDNTARRRTSDPTIVHGSTPERYERWLVQASERIVGETSDALVFVNAWNEWAEGAYLEPDLRWGRAYLEATLSARRSVEPGFEVEATEPDHEATSPVDFATLHAAALERYREIEREASTKFEAGQRALSDLVSARDREIAALRGEIRRLRSWAEAIDVELQRVRNEPEAVLLRRELEQSEVERSHLEGELQRILDRPYWRLRRWAARRSSFRRVYRRLRRTPSAGEPSDPS